MRVVNKKKLTMPAYCVAANRNNSQTTPGVIPVVVCELLRAPAKNQPKVRRKWNLYNSNELTFLLCCITPISVASTWVSAISQTLWILHGVCFEADTMFRYSFKILPDRLKLIRLYHCGSLRQSISFVFGAPVGHFAATPQSDVVGIWSRDLGVMATLTLRASLSGILLQTLPDLVTPLKEHSLPPGSCPATRSAPSERFGY